MGRQMPIDRNWNFMGFDMSINTKIEQFNNTIFDPN